MRIRKNADLSSLSGTDQVLQTHVCQLNQSPWDVISFSQEPTHSVLYQYEGEDSFNGNGSLGDSIGAVESSSVVWEDPEDNKAAGIIKLKVDNMDIIDDDNYEIEMINREKQRAIDEGREFSADSKGCHCDNQQKEANSMGPPPSKRPERTQAGTRRGRAKGGKKVQAVGSTNPYEFYYYSGFGPSWGRRRSQGKKNGSYNTTPFLTESHEELDIVDEDDDEDGENGDIGKKRMRKPVKARSLKSLM